MKDHHDDVQSFINQCREYVASFRKFLQHPDGATLDKVARESETFLGVAKNARTDSFYLVVSGLKSLLIRAAAEASKPSRLEYEAIELALDWLDQLTVLYGDNIPEPKTLVKDLLYTLKLVERSQGAYSLRELLAAKDPFSGDPELNSENYAPRKEKDPFAEDPGFGMEFDLLQRTLNMACVQQVAEDDPFNDDSRYEDQSEQDENITGNTGDLPYDVFDGDPPLDEQ